MKRNSIYDVNYLWMMLVFLHIAGSLVVSVIGEIPFGEIVLIGALCFILYYLYKDKRNSIFGILLIFALGVILLLRLPGEYHSSFLMNMLLLVFILYTIRCSFVPFKEYIKIRKIKIRSLICIICLTVCGIIISGFINGLSMLFFVNHAASSLSLGAQYKLECIFVYAVIPAIVEEIIFRGYILKGIGGTKKAIIISALLFALLHMNVNQMCYALFMGLFFGVMVIITDNVLVSIIMHFSFNLFSVLTAAFYNSVAVAKLYSIHIGHYYIFSPVLAGTKAQMRENIVTGLIVCLIAGIAAFLLIKLLEKSEKNKKAKSDNDKIKKNTDCSSEQKVDGQNWKPDIRFGIGCLLCIIVAAILQ